MKLRLLATAVTGGLLFSNCVDTSSPSAGSDPTLVVDLDINGAVANRSMYDIKIDFMNPMYGADRNGNAHRALMFDGAAVSYVGIMRDTILDFASRSFTISLWHRANTSQISGAGIIAKGLSEAEQFAIDIALNQYRFWVRDPSSRLYIVNSGRYADNQWHKIVATYDNSKDSLYFYLDDVLLGRSAAPSNLIETSEPITIGARANALGSYTFRFSGSISDLKIYNTVHK